MIATDTGDATVLEQPDSHTRLVGSNLMEILLFSLGTSEVFGINVFKVREVSKTPVITRSPNMPLGVEGLISLRGNVIPVLSLAKILGVDKPGQPLGKSMMVTEYSRRTLSFLVQEVDRIIRVDWEKVRQAENVTSSTQSHYISAITELSDGKLVSILDVETILSNAFGEAPIGHIQPVQGGQDANVFFADDSAIARKKIAEVLDKLGVRHRYALNGQEAWMRLEGMATHAQQQKRRLSDELTVILVDAEMPEMDGYVLTRRIKQDARFDGIPVVMHSSLSSEANRSMGKSVGVDAYVAKFDAGALAETLRPYLMMANRD